MHRRHIVLNGGRWAVVLFLCVLAAESLGHRAEAASSAVVWIEGVNVTVWAMCCRRPPVATGASMPPPFRSSKSPPATVRRVQHC